jgi:hypothetical protein
MGTLRGYDVRRPLSSPLLSSPLPTTIPATRKKNNPSATPPTDVPHALQVFLNVVLDEATESKPNGEKARLGMCVIRGNSVVMMEALDRIDHDNRGGGGGGGHR